MLCIDGCFIKTYLGGMQLSAIDRDPNEQMFPLAWAVVEGKNNEAWQWFLNELKKGLPPTNGDGLTIISDEHPVCKHYFLFYCLLPTPLLISLRLSMQTLILSICRAF